MAGNDKNKSDESVKEITKKLTSVIIDDIEPEEHFAPFSDIKSNNGYYIHLDVDSHSNLLKYPLNKYMVTHDAFDPRRATNHPSDLIQGTNMADNLTNRRVVSGAGNHRYEFWKVKADFSLLLLKDFILNITSCDTFIRATVIIDNEHLIFKFKTNNQQ
ncbi:hypothetical protein ACTFIU_010909 [Dictyostelium citrinum]